MQAAHNSCYRCPNSDYQPGQTPKSGINIRTATLALLIILTILTLSKSALADAPKRYLDILKETQPYLLTRTGPRDLIEPSIAIEAASNNNIYSDAGNRKTDFITLLRPRLTLAMNRRYRFTMDADVDAGSYASYTQENFTDYTLKAHATLLQSRSGALNSGIQHAKKHILRDSPDDENSLRPTIYHDTGVHIDYNYTVNRLVTIIELETESLNYLDASTISTTINNDDRDRTRTAGKLILGYKYRPPIDSFYLIQTIDKSEYRYTPDDNGYNRNTQLNETMAGITYGSPELFYIELNAKWIKRSFDDALFTPIRKTAFGANTTWQATNLTRIDLNSAYNIEETTLAGVSGILTNSARLAITHELLRPLKLQLISEKKKNTFTGINRADIYTKYGFNVKYDLNQASRLTASVAYTNRDSDTAMGIYDFSRTVLTLSGIFKF